MRILTNLGLAALALAGAVTAVVALVLAGHPGG